jgi:ribosomal-protein-alanine acetyltransferase
MICVRAIKSQDLPGLREIARGSPTAALWSERQFSELCSSETAGERLCLVVCDEKQVHGFLVAKSITQERDEWEIENVAVRAQSRRIGLGSRLVSEFLRIGRDRGGARVYLEVRESNHSARRLYERLGFAEAGRRKSYYQAPDEDALILRFTFPQPHRAMHCL